MAGASRAPRMIPIRPRGWPRWAQGRAHAIQLLVHALFAVGVLAVLFGGAAAARVHVAYAYDGGIEQSAATSVNLGLRTTENACQTQRASQSAGASASVVAAETGGSAAGRDALGRFTGAGGYGADAEATGLSDYELATGQTVIRNQVRASLSEGGSGRFYDGLVRNADGTYTGIEVKSGSASLNASQRAFDSAVNGGGVARATLNGQSIEITSTDLVRVP